MSALAFVALGYAICVVFPCPWLSGWVYRTWQRNLPWVRAQQAAISNRINELKK